MLHQNTAYLQIRILRPQISRQRCHSKNIRFVIIYVSSAGESCSIFVYGYGSRPATRSFGQTMGDVILCNVAAPGVCYIRLCALGRRLEITDRCCRIDAHYL
jgi:hypothetical protein